MGKIKVPSRTVFFFRSSFNSGPEDFGSVQVHQVIVTLLCSKLTVVVEVRLCECNLDVGFVGIQFRKFHLLGVLFI